MFSALLDVAIGIILLYTILSLTASALLEAISGLLKSRAKNLEYFLECVLQDSGIALNQFFEQSMITPQLKENERPSYISAADFAQTVLELMRDHPLNPLNTEVSAAPIGTM